MEKTICLLGLVCLLAGWSAPAAAAETKPITKILATAAVTSTTTMTELQKIDTLIKTVETAELTFIRNGSEYNSKRAAEHLRDKLKYALKRVKPGQQVTACDFIKLIATSSSFSKKPYMIKQKDGKTQPSGEWLTKRLEELEKAQAARLKGAPAPTPATQQPLTRPVAGKNE